MSNGKNGNTTPIKPAVPGPAKEITFDAKSTEDKVQALRVVCLLQEKEINSLRTICYRFLAHKHGEDKGVVIPGNYQDPGANPQVNTLIG